MKLTQGDIMVLSKFKVAFKYISILVICLCSLHAVACGNKEVAVSSVEDAVNILDFGIEIDDKYIHGGFDTRQISIIDDKILQIRYVGNNSIYIIRKALVLNTSFEDIVNAQVDKNNANEKMIAGNKVLLFGSNDKFTLAVWTSGKYIYSLECNPQYFKEMQSLIMRIS